VTLRLENTTLHAALRGLSAQTGYVFTGQGGLGRAGYAEKAGVRRASVAWSDVPLGKALRELQTAYGVTFTLAGPSELWVRNGPEIRRVESAGTDVAVSLPRIQQNEVYRAVVGAVAAKPERRLTFSLALRAPGGDIDTLGALMRLELVDSAGKTQQVPLANVAALPPLPDARRLSEITIPWEGADFTRLSRLEGDVQVFNDVRELRFAVPLAAPNQPPTLPLEIVQEGVRMRVTELAWAGSRLRCGVRLEWSPDSSIVPIELAPVRLLTHLVNGEVIRAPNVEPLPIEIAKGAADFQIARELPDRVATLEVLVAVRNRQVRTVPFRLEGVELPFSQPLALRREPLNVRPDLPATHDAPEPNAPEAFRDPRGGVLRLPAPPPALDGGDRSLAVGLSRQQGASWSPVRWVEVDPDDTPLRLTGLTPGNYRVRMRVTRRNAEGAVLPTTEAPVRTVVIRAGTETDWSSAK
jgi:hypothetical protein